MLCSSRGTVLYESGNRRDESLVKEGIPAQETIVLTLQDLQGTSMRVAARRDEPFVIQVAYSQGVVEDVLKHLLSIFAVLTPVVLLVAVAGGWLMAGIVLRPIREISERARTITATSLSGRITARSTNDELGELVETINGMIARLEKSFRNVRDFSRASPMSSRPPSRFSRVSRSSRFQGLFLRRSRRSSRRCISRRHPAFRGLWTIC
jgi:HAMP domain-containing protein